MGGALQRILVVYQAKDDRSVEFTV